MDNHHDVHNKLSIRYHLFTHIINSKSSSSYKYAKMSTSGNMNLSTYFYTNPQLSFDNCDHLLQTKQWLVFGQYSQSNCKLKSTFNFNFTYYHSLVMVITNYLYMASRTLTFSVLIIPSWFDLILWYFAFTIYNELPRPWWHH